MDGEIASVEQEIISTPSREMVMRLEKEILKYPQHEFQVKHHFSPGIYIRELLIPAGALLTGKIHRHEHFCIISAGDLSVLTEHGVVRLQAPCTFLSKPGIKRAGFAHADTVFSTVHSNPTNETDLTKIEAMYVVDSFDLLEVEQ
jgi:hypothetical protein